MITPASEVFRSELINNESYKINGTPPRIKKNSDEDNLPDYMKFKVGETIHINLREDSELTESNLDMFDENINEKFPGNKYAKNFFNHIINRTKKLEDID